MIRRASARDMAGVRRLIRLYPKHLVQDYIPRRQDFFVVVENKNVVGCCALEVYSKRLAELRSLAVHPDFQGKGIAQALIARCLAEARRKRVKEVLSITGATRLFSKLGFSTFRGEKYAMLKML